MAEEPQGVNTESVETPGAAPTPEKTTAQPASVPSEKEPTSAETPQPEATGAEEAKPTEKKVETRAEKRIRQLIDERDQLRQELHSAKGATPPAEPVRSDSFSQTPETRQAIDELKRLGFVDKDELRKESDRVALNAEYDRLEKEYDGSNGLPAFDRKVVQDFAVSKGLFDPESAYEVLYKDEIIDHARKEALASKPTPTYSEKPTASGARKPGLTRKDIGEMSTGEYSRRHDEIMEALRSGTLAEE